MRVRARRAASLFIALVAFAHVTRVARAEAEQEVRVGLVPVVGAGVATLTNAAPFVSTIGYSRFGVELRGEWLPTGAFFRTEFLSSGPAGRWTAPSLSLGMTRRVFGDGETTWALLLRGGALYDRWHVMPAGCPVVFFLPTNCAMSPLPAGSGLNLPAPYAPSITVDTLGAIAGVRVELPIRAALVAFDADVSGAADVDHASPGAVLRAGITMTVAFRDYGESRSPTADHTDLQHKHR